MGIAEDAYLEQLRTSPVGHRIAIRLSGEIDLSNVQDLK